MNLETYSTYCLAKPGVTESFPFDESTVVYKVGGKIFTLACILPFEQINVKCDPKTAIELRERYYGVQPGYHMNKKHWNTLLLNSDLTRQQIEQFIDHSYQCVKKNLPKKRL